MPTPDDTTCIRHLHFRDPRPPQQIQCSLEREHMVLLDREFDRGHLTYAGMASINGAPYRLLFRFEAALKNINCYSISIDIAWRNTPIEARDYHRKVAPSWLDLWLRDYTPSPPAPDVGRDEKRYAQLVQAAIAFEEHLPDVQAVQQEVIRRLRAGQSYSTAHKEGGTRIAFNNGRYIRADYGDNHGWESFGDEAAFLAFLRQFFDSQISRGAHPGKVGDFTAWKLLLRLLDPADPVTDQNTEPVPGPSHRKRQRNSSNRSKLALLLGSIGLAAVIGWGFLSDALAVKTTGIPMGTAIGTSDYVAILIRTQVPYLPSLHRNSAKDRFRVALLLQSRHGTEGRRLIPIVDDLDASQSQEAARLLGYDGMNFWMLARDIAGYNPERQRLIRMEDLQRATPGLASLWGVAHYSVPGKLVAMTRDRRVIAEVDPSTLAARVLTTPPRQKHVLPPHPVDTMLASAPAGNNDISKQAYVRAGINEPPLRLSNPDSMLLSFWRKTGPLQRMLFLARVAPDGRVVWEAQTGIDALQQVLPDREATALIGTRPRIPNKVPEPILTIVRNDTGQVLQHSLWVSN